MRRYLVLLLIAGCSSAGDSSLDSRVPPDALGEVVPEIRAADVAREPDESAQEPETAAPCPETTGIAQAFLPMPPEGQEWELTFRDEFNCITLDTDIWNVAEGPRRQGFWTPDAVWLDGEGNLVMATLEEEDKYLDGAIDTSGTFEQAFGYFEIRARIHDQPGHWFAFWLFCDDICDMEDEGSDCTEIDVMESPWEGAPGMEGSINHALHWNCYGEDGGTASQASSHEVDLSLDYHTYGLWWTPEEYVFYIDGEEMWRTSAGGVSQNPEYLIISDEVQSEAWFLSGRIEDAQLPDYTYVDYVRVYSLVGVPSP